MTLGEDLQRARENAGLSIDELARITNLRVGLISMMESGDFSQCGGDTYARGHIRNIARAIGISADNLLAIYDAEHSSDSRSIHAQLVDNNAAAIRSENRKLSWKVLAGVSVSIVLLIGVAQFALSAVDSEPDTSSVVTEAQPSASPTSEAQPTMSPSAPTEVVVIASPFAPMNSGMLLSGDPSGVVPMGTL